ncbi:MAG: hypothetical protein WCO26_01010 [Deltaproteobacteria bacterium]
MERNLFNVRHDRPLPLLDLTLGEVRGYPYNLNKTRIPRRRKCSWRVCSMQLQGLEMTLHVREFQPFDRVTDRMGSVGEPSRVHHEGIHVIVVGLDDSVNILPS